MPATVDDLKLSVKHKGIAHALVIDGQLNEYNMKLTSKDESWVMERIKKENCSLPEVFLMTIDDSGSVNIIKKQKKNIKEKKNKK